MLVSVVISAYNEENYLPGLIEDLKQQTYEKKNIEIVFINAMSTDNTVKILEEFRNNNTEFKNIKIIDNPKKVQPCGFNLGVKHSVGDVILKIDAHSKITKDFIENNVAIIKTGEYICGGRRPTIVEAKDNFSKTLHLVEENMFGSSIANYRKSYSDAYVNSIFHGMYKREVFDKVGLMDERLIRTEDNELHYRLRKYGYKIRYSNKILSYQYMRPTLKKMIRQKYMNGYWIGLTSHVVPKCLSIFHFVPFVFVVAIIVSLLVLPWTWLLLELLMGVYLFFTIIITVATILTNKFNLTLLLMPIILFLVHISYGLGTLVGLVKGFSWKKVYFKK
ncbi:glycosyltransferase, group 2 family protein [Gemella bergeri ATCC 700627]|uniref:Glycosyltransferase, group 2 family protein n=1 Tax=Gemella bergeri ATCC 700627 TaxID=1321820 RepID=U2QIA4_9BACL|nr:glycosyltransferase family 2 protein [Gemella bergeri]ERK56231.1 glycosyltransferase, group 2 family protein [Gemella bergeri ATCC 700627]